VNDLVQERIAKPKSDDMSMDEILASIRKIISSDDDNRHVKPSESVYAFDGHKDKINQDKLDKSLSAREQLLSLTKPDMYDSDNYHDVNRVTNTSHKIHDSNHKNNDLRQKSIYQKLSAQNDIEQLHSYNQEVSDSDNQKNNHDEEILRALNEIRNSLSSSYTTPRDAANMTETAEKTVTPVEKNKMMQFENDSIKKYTDDRNQQRSGKVIDATIKNNHADMVRDIDLKPAQFSGDAVPEFLKKFKKQQVSDRDKVGSNNNIGVKANVNYDFSSLPSFDEDSDVVTLTEKIMPTTQDNLKQQEQQEASVKSNFSKLRQSTEEIMRRATERNMTDNYDLSQEDSPMTAVIIRTLQPMLQEWIDKNMQLIAEQVLRDEFRRGLK
jgi:cell pole-organizing protein PopZ